MNPFDLATIKCALNTGLFIISVTPLSPKTSSSNARAFIVISAGVGLLLEYRVCEYDFAKRSIAATGSFCAKHAERKAPADDPIKLSG